MTTQEEMSAYIEVPDGEEEGVKDLIRLALEQQEEEVIEQAEEPLVPPAIDDEEGFIMTTNPGQEQKEEYMDQVEKTVNQLVEIQEQMAKHMAAQEQFGKEIGQMLTDARPINEEYKTRIAQFVKMKQAVQALTGEKRQTMEAAFKKFSQQFWPTTNNLKRQREAAYAKVDQVREQRSAEWDQWHALREKSEELLEGQNKKLIWAKYFELTGYEFNRYDTHGDTEQVDLQIDMNNPLGTLEMYAESHIEQEKEYNRD